MPPSYPHHPGALPPDQESDVELFPAMAVEAADVVVVDQHLARSPGAARPMGHTKIFLDES